MTVSFPASWRGGDVSLIPALAGLLFDEDHVTSLDVPLSDRPFPGMHPYQAVILSFLPVGASEYSVCIAAVCPF